MEIVISIAFYLAVVTLQFILIFIVYTIVYTLPYKLIQTFYYLILSIMKKQFFAAIFFVLGLLLLTTGNEFLSLAGLLSLIITFRQLHFIEKPLKK